MRQDVALHFLGLEEHQVHGILGHGHEALIDALLEALEFTLLQERFRTFDRPLAEDRAEDALGFLVAFPKMGEVILIEGGELVLA